MGRLLKVILWLVAIAAVVVVGYAYLGDLTPQTRDVSQPVELDAN